MSSYGTTGTKAVEQGCPTGDHQQWDRGPIYRPLSCPTGGPLTTAS
jgi:hypothetical protein